MNGEETPGPVGAGNPGEKSTGHLAATVRTDNLHDTNKPGEHKPTKEERMVRVFLEPEQSLNRFEAERRGDHCLHSTVAALQRRKGLTFHREWETVPGYDGSSTRVKRYWLAPESRPMALALLGEARS